MHRSIRRGLVSLVALTLVGAACTSDDDDDSAATPAPAEKPAGDQGGATKPNQ